MARIPQAEANAIKRPSRSKAEGRSAHLNIAGMPESAQASAERVPIKGAELIDSYDACAIFADKRPSRALSVFY